MRKLICLLLFVFTYNQLFAQEADKTRIYEIRSNIPVYACNVIGKRLHPSADSFDVPPYQSKFALVRNYQNDSVVIRFLDWVKVDSIKNPQKARVYEKLNQDFTQTTVSIPDASDTSHTKTTNRYFLISRQDLDSNCIKVYKTGLRKSTVFTIGLVTMPMKIRLSNFDFQGNLSLGTTAGAKIRISKYNPNYINLLFGASLSTVTLDSFSTHGKVAGQPITNIAVFSPSLGAVLEFGKAQAGIFYGWDFLNKSNQEKYGWVYNKKPWISIGFGFTIFSIDTKSSQATEAKNSVSSSM